MPRCWWMGRIARCAMLCTAIAAAIALTASARAGSINIVSNQQYASFGASSFAGTLDYQTASPWSTTGVLTVTLTNTCDIDHGGWITGFVFGINSADMDASATLVDAPAPSHPFHNLGFAAADIYEGGAALNGDFFIPDDQTFGIGVGETGTFTFNITALDAGMLTVLDFLDPTDPYNFLVRFSGFLDNCSGPDFVPGMMVVVPLPAPFALGAVALAGMILAGARGRRRDAAEPTA